MATTTTNYGFDIPQSTDLVKDGATAIATLGQDIDTAMNTALGTKKAGMVLLNTTSFSGVASQSINDVFSTTYDNYLILTSHTNTTGGQDMNFRLRVGGADNSTANSYVRQLLEATAGTVSGQRVTSDRHVFGVTNDILSNAQCFTIFNPFIAQPTVFISQDLNSRSNAFISFWAGTHNQSTSYTGFTIFPTTGNLTGKISVFGYSK